MDEELLTTHEAAALAGVGPSTIKRWADQGELKCVKTVGGHRRFERASLLHLLDSFSRKAGFEDEWIETLLSGKSHLLEAQLLEARAQRGRWSLVAEQLAASLVEMGRLWVEGSISIAQEHRASNLLSLALSRISAQLPVRSNATVCLLASAGEEQHSLGLSLAEPVLRELGWTGYFTGPRTPMSEIVQLVQSQSVEMVVISLTMPPPDPRVFSSELTRSSAACAELGIPLLCAGSGPWPVLKNGARRMGSYVEFEEFLRNLAVSHAQTRHR